MRKLWVLITAIALWGCSTSNDADQGSGTLILKVSVDWAKDSIWVKADTSNDSYSLYLALDSIYRIRITEDSIILVKRHYTAMAGIGRPENLQPEFEGVSDLVCIRKDVHCFDPSDTTESPFPLMMKIEIPDSLLTPKLKELALSDEAVVWSAEWGFDSLYIGTTDQNKTYKFYEDGFTVSHWDYMPMPASGSYGEWSLKAVRD